MERRSSCRYGVSNSINGEREVPDHGISSRRIRRMRRCQKVVVVFSQFLAALKRSKWRVASDSESPRAPFMWAITWSNVCGRFASSRSLASHR